MSTAAGGPATIGSAAAWHEVECGAYSADLPTWAELARQAAGPVLELGCGSGRVALELAARGTEVTAIDSSAELIAELRRRAAARGLELETAVADARQAALGRRFALVAAPMALVHLLGGEVGRRAMLERSAAALRPAGALAAALLADPAPTTGVASLPLPDVRELDGWIYSSQPVEVREAGDAIEVRRLRQLVSPDGRLREEVDAVRLDRLGAAGFEREAGACGLRARERIEVPPTSDHVGSTVCVLGVD